MNDQRIAVGTSEPLPFLMVQDSDHRSPAPGLSPVVSLSRNGVPFALSPPAAGAVTELGSGWYSLPGGPLNAGVVGPLLLHATAVGADPVDLRFEVVAFPGASPVVLDAARYPLTFLMVSASDHIMGVTGVSPTVTVAKVGGPFSPPAGSVYELGFGWYAVSPSPAETDTAGPLLLHATATGADITDERYDVTGLPPGGGPGGGGGGGGSTRRLGPGLVAVKSLLVNAGLFTNSSCMVSLDPEPFISPAPPCCAVTPGAWRFDQGLGTGGGRYQPVVEGEVVVRLVLRHVRDVATQDLLFLAGASPAGYPLAEDVVNVLDEQFLYTAAGDPISTCGLKPVAIEDPRPYRGDKHLWQVAVRFRTRLLLSLGLPDPM